MKIGVLTGGGDCPGLNAAIRGVVRRALEYGHEVIGIKNGWAGMVYADTEPMDIHSVSGILHLGGTKLGTSRTNPTSDPRYMDAVLENFKKLELDALVAIGGDDTLSVAAELSRQGLPVVGCPKTMDNDVPFTDFCIGFDSATTVVADALDRLHTTASAHHRVMVVEVMGRDAGWVAVYGGLAGGADYVIIPEEPHTIQEVCDHLKRRRAQGKDFSLIVVAEGAIITDLDTADHEERDAFGHVRLDRRSVGEAVADRIAEETGLETRATVLGHLQRGGSPSVFDRVLATRYGVAAVDFIQEGKFGYMTALQCSKIVPVSLAEVTGKTKTVDINLYEMAKVFY